METIKDYLRALSVRWTSIASGRVTQVGHFELSDCELANDLYRREERESAPAP